jgi:prolipoprotein diacylglyceryltransferase
MLLFLVLFYQSYADHPSFWQKSGFYVFILFYVSQRFFLEFLKPYPELLAGINLFQWLCLLLMLYGGVMLWRSLSDVE